MLVTISEYIFNIDKLLADLSSVHDSAPIEQPLPDHIIRNYISNLIEGTIDFRFRSWNSIWLYHSIKMLEEFPQIVYGNLIDGHPVATLGKIDETTAKFLIFTHEKDPEDDYIDSFGRINPPTEPWRS